MNIFTGRTKALVIAGFAALILAAISWGAFRFNGASAVRQAASCLDSTFDPFVWIEGGTFDMGPEDYYPDERPIRAVSVEGFWIRSTEVTNDEYGAFVEATGYRTVAERMPPEGGAPGSAVFIAPTERVSLRAMSWWHWVEGAHWRHPEGPGSSIETRGNHPVTHIAYEDATAYAAWAHEELPSEIEWEYAASAAGTVSDQPYRFEEGRNRPIANTWQGLFPVLNVGEDGHMGTSPAGCFEANAFGVFDMIGNVWEWTNTPAPAQSGPAKGTIKGGSFLCAPNFCVRYRPAAREAQETGLGTNHIGFRTVRREQ